MCNLFYCEIGAVFFLILSGDPAAHKIIHDQYQLKLSVSALQQFYTNLNSFDDVLVLAKEHANIIREGGNLAALWKILHSFYISSAMANHEEGTPHEDKTVADQRLAELFKHDREATEKVAQTQEPGMMQVTVGSALDMAFKLMRAPLRLYNKAYYIGQCSFVDPDASVRIKTNKTHVRLV